MLKAYIYSWGSGEENDLHVVLAENKEDADKMAEKLVPMNLYTKERGPIEEWFTNQCGEEHLLIAGLLV